MASVNNSLRHLKAAFLSVEVLKHFDPTQATLLEAYTSDGAIADCLSQTDTSSGLLRLVAFYSRKLIPIKEKYNIDDKELLAIVQSL
jgi:hypothetical protein